MICVNNNELNRTLKNNSDFEIINIDFNSSKSRELSDFMDTLEESQDIISLAKIIYSLYSGTPDWGEIASLATKIIKDGLFSDGIPSSYDFIKKYHHYDNFMQQRECEGAASYAVAILMTYRRLKNKNEYYPHLPFTIQEGLGICKKYNILDALNYAYKNGLIEIGDDCYSFYYDYKLDYLECYLSNPPLNQNDIKKSKKKYYKGLDEPYKIEGEENIKKEIYKRGPVITTYELYEKMVYYKSGYITKFDGNFIGYHEAIIYGWDNEGWLAQSVFGNFWGETGKFKVKYMNSIDFGYIAFALNHYINISIITTLIFILLLI